ncbi:MAG: VCBS repeat-containing protein [Alphaproteobacteria bacterium]|nr:VCBS repeat-containing protein [Alphaproteobacteria bacterium]
MRALTPLMLLAVACSDYKINPTDDGLVDTAGVDSEAPPLEECNGEDDDEDGLVDEGSFGDADEDGIADCVDAEECDAQDNDGDGRVDEGFADDSDLDGVYDCLDEEECDGLDNDGDSYVDEGYPGDSDADGTLDCLDVEECDEVDNDGDGLIDEELECDEACEGPGEFFISTWRVRNNSSNPEVWLWPSNGDGSFASPELVFAGSGAVNYLMGDFTEDGWHDIVVRDSADGLLRTLSWVTDADCNGAWTEVSSQATSTTLTGGGDLDGDGHLDLFHHDNDSGAFTLYLGAGDGSFTATSGGNSGLTRGSGALRGPERLGDVNGDGCPDNVLGKYTGSGIATTTFYLMLNRCDGSGGFGAAQQFATLNMPVNAGDMADLDQDGDVDLILGSDDDGDSGRVHVLWNQGGSLAAPVELADLCPTYENNTDRCNSNTRLWDYTGDGGLDLIATGSYTPGDVHVHHVLVNDGAGHFTEVWSDAVDAVPGAGNAVPLDTP